MNASALIDSLARDVKAIVLSVETEFVTLEDSILNHKESQGTWSILECFEHLNLYSRFYNKQFGRVIEHSKIADQDPEVRSNWIGRKFIGMMHPDIKRSKTLKHMDPSASHLDRTVFEEFLEHQATLLQILSSARRVDLNRAKIPVEFFRLLHMRLGDALQFVIVHEQRHLLQAKAVLARLHSAGSTLQI